MLRRLPEPYPWSCNVLTATDLTGRSSSESVHKSAKQSAWTRVDKTLCMYVECRHGITRSATVFWTAAQAQPTMTQNPNWSRNIEDPPASLVSRTRDSNDLTHAPDLPNNLATLRSVPSLKLITTRRDKLLAHEHPYVKLVFRTGSDESPC